MIVIKPVPVLEGNVWTRNAFGHEVFNLLEQGIGLRGLVDQAFKNVGRYGLAVMMVGPHHLAIHLVGCENVDVVAVGRGARSLLRLSAPRSQNEYSGNQKRGKESIFVVHVSS